MAAAVPLSHMELSTRCELRSALWAGASQGSAGLQGQRSGGGGAAVAHGAQHEVRAEVSSLGWGVARRRRSAGAAERRRRCRCRTWSASGGGKVAIVVDASVQSHRPDPVLPP